MALLDHPCESVLADGTVCDRVAIRHKGPVFRTAPESQRNCPQYKRAVEPRIVETYIAPSLPGGQTMVLGVTPPGTFWPPNKGGLAEKTCGCVACHDAYLREGGVAEECRCRPCAIAAAQRDADAAAAEELGITMADDMGPAYDAPTDPDGE